MVVERSELRLVWPADLFACEALQLLESGPDHRDTVGWLLAEAFHDDRALKLYDELDGHTPSHFTDGHSTEPWISDVDPWGSPAWAVPGAPAKDMPVRRTVRLLEELAATASQIPTYAPRRYYAARISPRPETTLAPAETRIAWAREVIRLTRTWYLEDAFGSACGDSREDPDAEGQRRLAGLLDVDAKLWPLESWVDQRGVVPRGVEQSWPEELFYSVVEAVHDLVARPRRRWWHQFCEGWDYSDFARGPGRAVYSWRVNDVLARSEVGLRLADTGEETGLLVRTAADGREALLTHVVAAAADQDTRQHAIALFRGRSAGVPDKRSAIVALARLLEERRALLKAELLSKDEGALFDIANNFDLRHHNASQRTDYDPAFLDWLFWWYLGTLDLTDQLLGRQVDGSTAGSS